MDFTICATIHVARSVCLKFKPTGSTTAALTYFMHQVTCMLEKTIMSDAY